MLRGWPVRTDIVVWRGYASPVKTIAGVSLLEGRYLSFEEREEEVALGRAAGESIRSIALRLGRSPSTISRRGSQL